jgi:hypothetical protein
MNLIGTRIVLFSETTGNLTLMFKLSLRNVTFAMAKQIEIYLKIYKS